MPFRKRETAEHIEQELHFKDIEKSLRDAKDLLVASKREIARSKQIMQESDATTDKAKKDHDDAKGS